MRKNQIQSPRPGEAEDTDFGFLFCPNLTTYICTTTNMYFHAGTWDLYITSNMSIRVIFHLEFFPIFL